jgi:EAL domain-containing protein (putative c-di-GMP-specific phosphodiesterase class I)
VLISGLQDLSTALRAIDNGVLRYLNKPFEPAVLVKVIEGAVRLYKQARLKREALAVCEAMPSTGASRLTTRRALDRALGTMYMAFQPVVSMSLQRIVAYEALLRTGDDELAQPGAMLAAAEQLDRMNELGRAIRERCAAAAAQLPQGVILLVNLHPGELLDEALFEGSSPLAGIAGKVVLEITERARLEEVEGLQERTRKLRQLGYRLAVDDIGSGYAGLNSFAQLNPEVVKLDMALVRGIEREATKKKVVGSLVELSRSLGVKVIAEGVETPAERDALVSLGCDLLQGFYFARPAPPFALVDAARFAPETP